MTRTQDEKNDVPPHLQSTWDLLLRVFPSGVPDGDYLPLLAHLYPHMCDGNLAEVIAAFTGRPDYMVANDVLRVGAGGHDGSVEYQRLAERLAAAGLEAWAATPLLWAFYLERVDMPILTQVIATAFGIDVNRIDVVEGDSTTGTPGDLGLYVWSDQGQFPVTVEVATIRAEPSCDQLTLAKQISAALSTRVLMSDGSNDFASKTLIQPNGQDRPVRLKPRSDTDEVFVLEDDIDEA